MSELPADTAMPSADDAKAAAIRTALIGTKVTIPDTAKALDVSERAIYYALERTPVPYVVIFGTRYYEPTDLARAVVAERSAKARGRGRPRKAA